MRILSRCLAFPRQRCSLLTAALLLILSSTAQAGFLYTKVADSRSLAGGMNDIGFAPQINNNNQVAILLLQSSNGFLGGITSANRVVRSQNGVTSTIASSGDAMPGRGPINFMSRVAIGDSGNVAFRASYTFGGGSVLLANSGGLQEIFNDLNSLNNVRVNSSDRVLTSVQSNSGSPIIVQSRTPGGTITEHASNAGSGDFSNYGSGGAPNPDINDSGQVALRGTLRSTFQDGVYITSAGNVQSVANSSNGFATFGNNVDINNNSEVAFLARPFADPAGRLSVYKGIAGQSATQVASQANFNSISDFGPAINDAGLVMFQANFNGSEAIFSGGNPNTDRIIGGGDSLDGGIITSVFFGRGMLNNAGNFVFYSLIDDNNDGQADRSAVFLAFSTVPEPTCCAVLACLLPALIGLRRKPNAAVKWKG